jgi:hypothetical protein
LACAPAAMSVHRSLTGAPVDRYLANLQGVGSVPKP